MKSLFSLLFVILSVSLSAQVEIIVKTDRMTDEVFYYPNKSFVSANDAKTRGIRIDQVINAENNKVDCNGWIVKHYDVGICNHENTINILFEDDTRLEIYSWSDFTCENVSYFDLTLEQEIMLMTKKVSHIRFTNGYTFDRYTGKPIDSNYFIDMYDAVDRLNN